MLRSLHVKNLALIDEAEVEFGEGLNILSGETGAGKSIIIGSINLALGGKVQKEMLRENADAALVELIFEVKEENIKAALAAMDVSVSPGCTVTVCSGYKTRRLWPTASRYGSCRPLYRARKPGASPSARPIEKSVSPGFTT